MRLRFTRRAIENLIEIANHIRTINPEAAQKVRAAIYRSLKVLLLFPSAGRPQATVGVRKLVTRQYSYIVYYRVSEELGEIVILAIKHPAQRREHSDR